MMSLERALMVPTLLSIFINELGKMLDKVMFADWTELFRKVKIIKLITKICRIILRHQTTVDMCKEVNLRKITLTLTVTLSKDPSWIYCGLFYETVISILSVIQKSKQDYQAKTAFGYLHSKTISMMFPHSRFCMLLWLPLMYRKDINKQGEWSEVYHGFQTRI